MNDRYSKLAFLHRVKERKTPSLSVQASFAFFSLKVAWYGKSLIPDLGEAPMEAAILVHVHPLGPSFRPGGGQALPLPTVNSLTLYSVLLMIALEIHHQLN